MSTPAQVRQYPRRPRLFDDTDTQTEQRLLEGLRRRSPRDRLRMVAALCLDTRRLALSGLERRHPELSDTQRRRLLADILLGEELAESAYGPRDEGR